MNSEFHNHNEMCTPMIETLMRGKRLPMPMITPETHRKSLGSATESDDKRESWDRTGSSVRPRRSGLDIPCARKGWGAFRFRRGAVMGGRLSAC